MSSLNIRSAATEKPMQWPPPMPSFWLSIHSWAAGMSAHSSPVPEMQTWSPKRLSTSAGVRFWTPSTFV